MAASCGTTRRSRPTFSCTSSLFRVLLHCFRSDLGSVNVARRIDRDAFRRARARRLLVRIGNEAEDLAVLQAAVTDPALPAVVIARHGLGFGVGDVEDVVLVDPHAARPAELAELLNERAVLIEDL